MTKGRTMTGILSRRRTAALPATWEASDVGSAREKPESLRLQAEIDSLKVILADSERRVQALENERAHLIPVEDVHRELDRFNLPRRTPQGWNYFVSERFALLRVRMEVERG